MRYFFHNCEMRKMEIKSLTAASALDIFDLGFEIFVEKEISSLASAAVMQRSITYTYYRERHLCLVWP